MGFSKSRNCLFAFEGISDFKSGDKSKHPEGINAYLVSGQGLILAAFKKKAMKHIRRAGLVIWFSCFDLPTWACPFCNPQIKAAIYDSQFYPNLLTMLSAFIALAVVVAILSAFTAKRHRGNVARYPNRQLLTPVPLVTTAMILGIGVGGFIDGIVLHQILQWHEMLSNKIPATNYVGKSVNMFWDGIFHAFTLIVTLVGIILLWKLLYRKDINRSGYLFTGGMLIGWGVFNIVEGVIDHHLLKLHNVREISANPEIWNYGFLGLSIILILIGYALTRKAKHVHESS
jgi:uncharacterized membrane protein